MTQNSLERQTLLDKSHQLELVRLQFECYNPKFSSTNEMVESLLKLRDSITIQSDVLQEPVDLFKQFKDLLSYITTYDLTSYLDKLPLPVTSLQLFSLTLFMFNLIMLMCLVSYMVNEAIKFYGDKFKERLPKWMIFFVTHILTVRKYVGYTDLMIILMNLLFSMIMCVLMYSLSYLS